MPTAFDPLLISVISACTALVASIVGPLVTFVVAKRQFNATVLSANRQKWIESLRDMLAELISLLATASVVKSQWAAKWDRGLGPINADRALMEKLARIVLVQAKIRLLLNPNETDHQRLYDAIDQRCVQMIEQGLVQEVSDLVQQGYELHLKPLQSVGYRHAGMIITGQMDASEALALMQRDTRHLARRQLTWFRAEPGIRWFDPDARVDIYKAVKRFLLKGDGGEQWCG